MDKLKELIAKMNEQGIPIPVLRDPIKKTPSVTFTFFVLSGIYCFLASSEKVSTLLGTVDFSDAKELLMIFGAAYLTRQWQKKGDTTTIEDK